jgi:hypothetical protein
VGTNRPADREFGDDLSAAARTRLKEFVERYPDIPIVSIIRCLVEVDDEAALTVMPPDRAATAMRLAGERLDELNGRYRREG